VERGIPPGGRNPPPAVPRLAAVRVTANGRPYEVGDETTVDGFIRLRGLNPQLVVVELNGEALERARYGTELSDGDRLELVRAVAGG